MQMQNSEIPIKLQYDRQITISTAPSRKSTKWAQEQMSITQFYARLGRVSYSSETLDEYYRYSKSKQNELKDVGGFVGGSLNGGRRKADAITGRGLITLDYDNIPKYGTEDVIHKLDVLENSYCIYSTRKHNDATGPRLRIIIPTDRTLTVDEYEPCARKVAERIGIHMADSTTFEASRLMYWPSCCMGAEFVYRYKDGPLIQVNKLLESYTDWKDFSSWPRVPGEADVNKYRKLAAKQGNPEEKPGVVGAFCRVHDVFSAMEKYLPGIYEQCDNDQNRYTYLGGSTAGGAVIYDDGKFLYSHHATDPCSGKLVNAFDLVRLHKFGELDDEAVEGTPVNRLPSYKAMCELAVADTEVAALVAKERHDEAVKDFDGVNLDNADDSVNWMQKLQVNPQTGAVVATIENVLLILNNDSLLKGKVALNGFSSRNEVLGKMPWSTDTKRRLWSDTDSSGLYWYMERAYKIAITKSKIIDTALSLYTEQHKFNEVQDYIKQLEWDGVPRLDTLFIDYLGAEDDGAKGYTRAVTRKIFTAAVKRVMEPGCKFDNMLILCGRQGIGKSTILDKMSRGWFNDSIRTFEGKDASELLPGVWLVEIAELDAFRKTDVSRIKQFLSLRVDRYRAAYGRNVKELPRCCVFFGTCNQVDFLQDTTGNRRFWPVDVGEHPSSKNVWEHLDNNEIDQIWAEAKMRWQLSESLFLKGELEKIAEERQEAHRESSSAEGIIAEFAAKPIPKDWSTWPLDRRRDFWANNAHGDYELVERDRICSAEVWCELYYKPLPVPPRDSREINKAIKVNAGWKQLDSPRNFGDYYGSQRGFERVSKLT